MRKIGLLPRLIIAIILGIIIGLIAPQWFVRIFVTFSSIFGSFLSFIIPLIILGFVAPGIAELGEGAGKLLGITAALAYISTILAGSLSYFASSTIFPTFLEVGSLTLNADPEANLLETYIEIGMPPVFDVMTALVLAFLIGLGVAAVKAEILKKALNEFQMVINLVISKIIIPFLPLHILGIFANMTYAGQVATVLSVFARVFVIVIALHLITIVVQYLVAGSYAGANPFKLIKNMIPAYLTALGTQSSAATIPVTLERTKLNGVSDEIADFVIPLGATIHLSGSTITLVGCSLAIMMLNGQNTTFIEYLPFIMLLGVTMVAAPGVPGGAVIAALAVLETTLGFDESMLSLMIALYVAQDSFGTATNITGDGAIAIIMNKFSGKELSRDNI